MGCIGGAVILVVADQHERRYFDLFQAIGVVMLLARQNEIEIVIHWRDARHSDFEKILDQLGIFGDEFFSPAGFDGVLANIAFEAMLDHVAAHGERNAVGAGVCTSRWRRGLTFLPCSDNRAPGAARRRRPWSGRRRSLARLQMVQDRRGVVGKHLDRIFLNRLARLAGAAIVEQDDFVIAGKLRAPDETSTLGDRGR